MPLLLLDASRPAEPAAESAPPVRCPNCRGPLVHQHLASAGGWVWYCPACHPRPPWPHGDDTLFTVLEDEAGRQVRRTGLNWEQVLRRLDAARVRRVEVEPVSSRSWRNAVNDWGSNE